MQLLTRFKNVVFYGNILRIPTEVQYIAADAGGTVWGFEHKPFISTARPDTFSAARDGRRILLGAAVKWSAKEAANTAWKQSLHECVADERWMVEAAAILKTAVNLMTDNKPAFAGACLQAVADRTGRGFDKGTVVFGYRDQEMEDGQELCEIGGLGNSRCERDTGTTEKRRSRP